MGKKRFMKMVLSGTAVVLVLMLNAQNVQTEKVNLVENGGFEDGVFQWDGAGIVDSENFKDGKNSLKLDNAGKAVFIYKQQSITAKLKPSTEYVFSVDINRTVNKKGKVMAAVLEKATKDAQDWTSTHECGKQGQVGKWEHFEVKFTTGSDICDAVVILYNINTEGTAWYDNVSIIESR